MWCHFLSITRLIQCLKLPTEVRSVSWSILAHLLWRDVFKASTLGRALENTFASNEDHTEKIHVIQIKWCRRPHLRTPKAIHRKQFTESNWSNGKFIELKIDRTAVDRMENWLNKGNNFIVSFFFLTHMYFPIAFAFSGNVYSERIHCKNFRAHSA